MTNTSSNLTAFHLSAGFRRFIFTACLCVALAASTVRARQQQPQAQEPQLKGKEQAQPTIAVEVKTVAVLATVHDKHGKVVSNLGKDDFQLDEDGRLQTINYFAHESDLPLRLGLLVDTSRSQSRVLDQERSASYSFLDHLLREGKDLAFVIHFDHQVELLQEFTTSRPKLQAALQALQIGQSDSGSGGNDGGAGRGHGGSGGGGGRGGHSRSAGTQLYDAIYLASDELMSKEQGRKAVIVLSDGVDRGSKETLGEAIAAAQRADTIVYSVYFKDEEEGLSRPGGFGMGGHGGYGGHGGRRHPQEERPDGKKILEQISKETGGRLFEASKKETMDKIYAEIDEELRSQYSLAYTPDEADDPGYHKIHLVAKQKDLIVQTKDGYYSGK
ncbi:MAG TPA: VWA domain-containing protein [Candidatus Methylomirabilis sp.]|nr:VWA domain-containing protein [Candidatus Methylomirabilis sp.]